MPRRQDDWGYGRDYWRPARSHVVTPASPEPDDKGAIIRIAVGIAVVGFWIFIFSL